MSRARILEPYTRRVDDTRHRVSRVAVGVSLILLAMLMGFVIAILPMAFLIIPLTPVLLLAAVALWLAPDTDANYDLVIRKLMLWFLAISMVWPDYIALTMPGIGWLSPQRLVMGMLFFVSLFALATSSPSRAHVKDVISHVRWIYLAFIGYVVLQLVLASVWVSFTSRFFYAQIFWYYMFVLSAWTFANPNSVRRLYQIVLVGFSVQCVFGMLDFWQKAPIWSGYLPPWLIVDDELVSRILGYSARAGTDIYRVSSIYLTPLTFAEAISVFLPFVVFAIFYGRNFWARAAAGALLLFAFYNGIWTDARSAMLGFLIAVVGMVGLWALQRYRRLRAERDIVAPAVVWAYPAGVLLVIAAVLSVHRVRIAVLGGGQHKPSNAAREVQWERTWDLLMQNPIGYGPFTAAQKVGYRNLGGGLTIDGYMMNLLVDTGVLGWLLFLVLFLGAAVLGVRTFLRSGNHEEDLAGPMALAVFNFIVIKLVLSQTENHHFMFMFVGAIVALHWRQQKRLKAEAPDRAMLAPGGRAPARGPGALVPAGSYGIAANR